MNAEAHSSSRLLSELAKEKMKKLSPLENAFSVRKRKDRCVICGMLIIDTDRTGLTCGNPVCLERLGDKFIDLENSEEERDKLLLAIERIGEILGFGNKIQDEDELKKIAQKIEDIKASIISTARNLGIDVKEAEEADLDDLEDFCNEIAGETEELKSIIEK